MPLSLLSRGSRVKLTQGPYLIICVSVVIVSFVLTHPPEDAIKENKSISADSGVHGKHTKRRVHALERVKTKNGQVGWGFWTKLPKKRFSF